MCKAESADEVCHAIGEDVQLKAPFAKWGVSGLVIGLDVAYAYHKIFRKFFSCLL